MSAAQCFCAVVGRKRYQIDRTPLFQILKGILIKMPNTVDTISMLKVIAQIHGLLRIPTYYPHKNEAMARSSKMPLPIDVAQICGRVEEPTNQDGLLDRIVDDSIPNELKEMMIESRTKVGVIDVRQLREAKCSKDLANIQSELLSPFQGYEKLRAMATDLFYRTNIFRIRVAIIKVTEAVQRPVILDDLDERNNVQHLDVDMAFEMREAAKDASRETEIGQAHAAAVYQIAALYPNLRSIRISLEHDPNWFGWFTRYRDPATKHETGAWEASCVLAAIISSLREMKLRRPGLKEIRLDQNTYFDVTAGVVKQARAADATAKTVSETVAAIMDSPHNVTRV